MDTKKIGGLLRELRKERGLTQEQLAEILNVSNRTVSRWETGYNMPDLDILIELSDYYHIDLREILDGERKSEEMDKITEETILKTADYSNEKAEKFAKRINLVFITGSIMWTAAFLIRQIGAVIIAGYSDLYVMGLFAQIMSWFNLFAGILLICGLIMTICYKRKLTAFKKRLKKKLTLK